MRKAAMSEQCDKLAVRRAEQHINEIIMTNELTNMPPNINYVSEGTQSVRQ